MGLRQANPNSNESIWRSFICTIEMLLDIKTLQKIIVVHQCYYNIFAITTLQNQKHDTQFDEKKLRQVMMRLQTQVNIDLWFRRPIQGNLGLCFKKNKTQVHFYLCVVVVFFTYKYNFCGHNIFQDIYGFDKKKHDKLMFVAFNTGLCSNKTKGKCTNHGINYKAQQRRLKFIC